jgi:hypothetical protein
MTSFQNSITPIKIGIKFDPPSILLVYRDKGKLRSRQIPAKNVDILTDVTLYVEKFKEDAKYKKYFEKIPHKRLEKIVFILQDNMKGYTLKESLIRAKKFDDKAINDDTDITESNFDKSDYKNKEKNDDDDDKKNENDYDDDDFHDTEDEDDKNEPSVSTIEDVRAKKEIKVNLMDAIKPSKQSSLAATTTGMSKTSALDLLSTQIKSVKNSIYDFEDDIEEDINKDSESDQDDDDENSEKNMKKTKKKKDEDKMEVAQDNDSSDSSF